MKRRAAPTASIKPRIGISACLLGEPVRYDGGHKRDAWLVNILGRRVEYVPVCPEVEFGLGVPRDTIRLQRGKNGIRLVVEKTGRDITRAMDQFTRRRVRALARENLSGYIFKKNSPSCGVAGVKVFNKKNIFQPVGVGRFAAMLMRMHPQLPVADESELQTPPQRNQFLARALAYQRRRQSITARKTSAG